MSDRAAKHLRRKRRQRKAKAPRRPYRILRVLTDAELVASLTPPASLQRTEADR